MSKPELKTAPAARKFKLGDRVLYTPETTVGNMNGMREYLAFVGQVEEGETGGGDVYHLIVFPPFNRPQWFANVRFLRPGELQRGSFRALPGADEVPE
jgi:hypothetical protein